MRTVLLIAFHFPPVAGSSGLQRTLRFAQYLPEFGWKPVVLTVGAPTLRNADAQALAQIPAGCEVVRAPCFDIAQHLSVGGRYPQFLALPDRWASWRIGAVPIARRIVRERRIEAVWSTYPIPTAHKIGHAVARACRLPWIADFRDPMAQDGYPPEPRRWRSFKRIEEAAARDAARLVFVTPSARELYLERYPGTPSDRFVLLENGYDESTFEGIEEVDRRAAPVPVLLHSGIVYPEERDPSALFEALGRLQRSGAIGPGDFLLRFRAPVHGDLLRALAQKHQVGHFIEIAPRIPYGEALREMLEADALLVMQGSNCNEQIPAKLYEYLRARRPILPLADPDGDTGRTISSLGYPFVTKLESADGIVRNLPRFVAALKDGALPVASGEMVSRYSRRTLTGRLAEILDSVAAEQALAA